MGLLCLQMVLRKEGTVLSVGNRRRVGICCDFSDGHPFGLLMVKMSVRKLLCLRVV